MINGIKIPILVRNHLIDIPKDTIPKVMGKEDDNKKKTSTTNIQKQYYTELYESLEEYKKYNLVYIEPVISYEEPDKIIEALTGSYLALRQARQKLCIDYGYWLFIEDLDHLDDIKEKLSEYLKSEDKAKYFLGICMHLPEQIDQSLVDKIKDFVNVMWVVDTNSDYQTKRGISQKLERIIPKETTWLIVDPSDTSTMSDIIQMDDKSKYLDAIKTLRVCRANDKLKQGLANTIDLTLVHQPELQGKIPFNSKEYESSNSSDFRL